jgi:hypothetical protein
MIAAIISVLVGIFPDFMMGFVDMITPDNMHAAMPAYDPAGAPAIAPTVAPHGPPAGH